MNVSSRTWRATQHKYNKSRDRSIDLKYTDTNNKITKHIQILRQVMARIHALTNCLKRGTAYKRTYGQQHRVETKKLQYLKQGVLLFLIKASRKLHSK